MTSCSKSMWFLLHVTERSLREADPRYNVRRNGWYLVLWKSQNVAFEGRWIQEPVTPQILTRFPAIRHFTRRPKKGWLPTLSISLGSTLSLHCYNKQWSFCCHKRTEFSPINITCAFLIQRAVHSPGIIVVDSPWHMCLSLESKKPPWHSHS